MSPDEEPETPPEKRHWFTTTHWSDVLAAAENDSPSGKAALERLCKTYWYPLYAFLRRDGKDEEKARVLVQGFFERFLKSESLSRVQRTGKFRSFLLASLKHYVFDEKDTAKALKRGGDKTIVSLDDTSAEDRYQHEPANDLDPATSYDLEWARTVFKQAGRRLEEEYRQSSKSEQYQDLRAILTKETNAPSYAEVAARRGCPEGTVKSDVSRLRQRFRELIREAVAGTVSDPAEIDEEFGYLISLLRRGGTNWQA